MNPDLGYPIQPNDLARFHAISRLFEDELHEIYNHARQKYGADAAGAVLVCILRQKFNNQPDSWPPPEDLINKVNKFLVEQELVSPIVTI